MELRQQAGEKEQELKREVDRLREELEQEKNRNEKTSANIESDGVGEQTNLTK